MSRTRGNDRWDQHGGLKKGHEENARAVDQPIAGLLNDLKARGLLDSTLVVWAGEFGRTPFAQGSDGRDHNPFGFSIWLAGGGVEGGTIYGATDEYGYKVIDEQSRRSTICTPRCCISWASTTSDSPTASAAATCG